MIELNLTPIQNRKHNAFILAKESPVIELNLTPIQNRKHNAFILAADAVFWNESGLFRDGFTKIADNFWMIAAQSHLVIRERAPLETNPHYRQLIPYVILRRKPLLGKPEYFCYRRMKGVGEARLAGNYSIGIGGHIEAEDFVYYRDDIWPELKNVLALKATVNRNIKREVAEEFGVIVDTGENAAFDPIDNPCTSYGIILDNSNDVGKVHAGLVYMVDIIKDSVLPIESKEEELEAGGFSTAEDLLKFEEMEGWSKLVLEYLVSVDSLIHHPV